MKTHISQQLHPTLLLESIYKIPFPLPHLSQRFVIVAVHTGRRLLGSGSTDGLTLIGKSKHRRLQSLLRFAGHTCHSYRVLFVDFPPTGRSYNAIGEPTGRCPTKA